MTTPTDDSLVVVGYAGMAAALQLLPARRHGVIIAPARASGPECGSSFSHG